MGFPLHMGVIILGKWVKVGFPLTMGMIRGRHGEKIGHVVMDGEGGRVMGEWGVAQC